MKRFQTEYSENCITYWPSYVAGKIGIVYLVVIESLFVSTALWVLIDNSSRETRMWTLVALPLVVFALCVVLRYVYRHMLIKIIISKTGIMYFRNNVTAEKVIEWQDVKALYFYQDLWYGRKSCKIFLKKISAQKPQERDKCDFILPVHSVDEQKLLQLIPKHLWKNNPWYS